MLSRLSFRYRVPLNLSLIVLFIGILISSIVLLHDYSALRDDARHNAVQFGRLLSQTLAPQLAVDDTWSAYRSLSAIYRDSKPNWLLPEYVLVLDSTGNTLVSSHPQRFPLMVPAALPENVLEGLLELSATTSPAGSEFDQHDGFYRVVPISSGNIRYGSLVMAYSNAQLWPRFYHSATRVLLASGVILLILLPLGWWLGQRLAKPLAELESCVARWVDGENIPKDCPVGGDDNELSRLTARIRAVSSELREKVRLERQVALSKRQAALGRLAAGVAHEINNPLGGLITSVATLKRHGQDEQVRSRTLSLLERGLGQIRYIVSALLVDIKTEPRPFSARDWDDIAELVKTQAQDNRVQLEWKPSPAETFHLAAGPMRQIVLNLTLNAIQAAGAGGTVIAKLELFDSTLKLLIENTGQPIPADQWERLFEPFSESSWGGNGLGLWITDQTVRQMKGKITVDSTTERTVFEVELPLAQDWSEQEPDKKITAETQ